MAKVGLRDMGLSSEFDVTIHICPIGRTILRAGLPGSASFRPRLEPVKRREGQEAGVRRDFGALDSAEPPRVRFRCRSGRQDANESAHFGGSSRYGTACEPCTVAYG